MVERLDADGAPDPTFGTGGVVTISQGVGTPDALAVQPDGSTLVAGPIYGVGYSFGVLRLLPNGAVDTSFGTNGTALLPVLASNALPIQGVSSLAVTSDGHIIVAGVRMDGTIPFGVYDIVVARFDATGTLDTTFGTSGLATVPVPIGGFAVAEPLTIVIQPSGRIVVAGEAQAGTADNGQETVFVPVVVGLTASGTLDPTFGGPGTAGVVVLGAQFGGVRGTNLTFDDMVMRPDGSLLLEATQYSATTQTLPGSLVRLTVDGKLDPTFGTGGTVPIPGPLVPQGVAIEGDGKIVVFGSVADTNPYASHLVAEYYAAGRFNADGTPDATFGQPSTPGVEVYPTSTEYSWIDNAFFDSAGHLILTGSAFTYNFTGGPTTYNFQVFRADTSATVTPATLQPPADLAGTGQTDLAVYLPGPSVYAYVPATGGVSQFVALGTPGAGQTLPAVADYDGLGHAQIADYLPASGTYQVQATAGHPGVSLKFGQAGAGQSIPAPGDYYGTGQDDIAVFLTGPAVFAIKDPTGRTPGELVQLGIGGLGQSIPVPADYYGTGQSDIAVYLPQYAAFVIKDPTGKTPGEVVPFGKPGLGQSIPVPGDYDGSGKVELAVYIPSAGAFIYRPAGGGPDVTVPFGFANSGEIPVPGDYDGSGHDEVAVYDETRGFLAYRPANGGRDVVFTIGKPNDGTVAAAASPGSQPEFTGSGGPRAAAIGPDLAASGSTAPPSTVASKAAVPSGPLPSLARVARTLVNQGIEDPSPSAN